MRTTTSTTGATDALCPEHGERLWWVESQRLARCTTNGCDGYDWEDLTDGADYPEAVVVAEDHRVVVLPMLTMDGLGGAFPGTVTGHWNGWAAPTFDALTAQRVVQTIEANALEAQDAGTDPTDIERAAWTFANVGASGRTEHAVVLWRKGEYREVVRQDVNGRFAIGAESWCWYTV